MLRGTLRLTTALVIIMVVGSSLALLVGRFLSTQMLTTTLTTLVAGNRSGITDFLLIDLNRHIRVQIPIPVDEIEDIRIDGNGQEAILLTGTTDKHLYRYNLITDTLFELNSAYIDPETGEVFQLEDIYSWASSTGELWDYNPLDGAVYRLDVASNTIEHVITLLDEEEQRIVNAHGLTISSSRTQAAIVDRRNIYVFNTDGSHSWRYRSSSDNFFGYWSQDEQVFFVMNMSTETGTPILNILDLDSREITATLDNLHNSTFPLPSCSEQNEWLAYVDILYEGYLLNYQTGEIQNLSSIPELADQQIDNVYWSEDCEWLFVNIDVSSASNGTGFETHPVYMVSRDGQVVHFLGEKVSIIERLDNGHFLLMEHQAEANVVYEMDADGTRHQPPLGSFVLAQGSGMYRLFNDSYRYAIYNEDNHVSLLDIRSGVIEDYFAPDELIGSFPMQWFWN